MSQIHAPWTKAMHQLETAYPHSDTPNLQADWQLANASALEVAERFVDLSAFVYKGFCTGILMLDLPIFTRMKHLSNRLYAYAFSLVVEKSVNFLTRPGQSTTLDTSRAARSMGQLAAFLERKALDLSRCGLSNGTEAGLAGDLRFAERYTTGLLEPMGGGLVRENLLAELQVDTASQYGMDEKADSANKAAVETVTGSNSVKEEPKKTPKVADTEVEDLRDNEHRDLVKILLHTRSAGEYGVGPSQHQATLPGSQKVHTDPAVARVNAEIPVNENEESTPGGHPSPHDLRPTPFNIHHAPHPLQGPRLVSRLGLAEDAALKQSASYSTATNVATPDPCQMIQIGHDASEVFHSYHFADASYLGFPGVDTLKITHPLCAQELRTLDFDVLRLISLVLGEKSATHAVGKGNDASELRLSKVAQRKSLWLVRRELESRKTELERGKQRKADSVVVGEEAEEFNESVESQWPTSTSAVTAATSETAHPVSELNTVTTTESLPRSLTAASPSQTEARKARSDKNSTPISPKSSLYGDTPSVEELRVRLAAVAVSSPALTLTRTNARPSDYPKIPLTPLQAWPSSMSGPHEEHCGCDEAGEGTNSVCANNTATITAPAPARNCVSAHQASPPLITSYVDAKDGKRYVFDALGGKRELITGVGNNDIEQHSPGSSATSPKLKSSRGRARVEDHVDEARESQQGSPHAYNGCSSIERADFEAHVLEGLRDIIH